MDTSNSGVMDTEPGGENTQYESIKTVTEPTEKQSGQLGSGMSNTSSSTGPASKEQGEKTAEKARYGQNMSETGMGGMTNSSGSANQDGGAPQESTTQEDRAAQGYGAGNDVGA